MIEGLPEQGWTALGMGESATLVRHRPSGREEQSYVVIRKVYENRQQLLTPAYTVLGVEG